MQCPRCHASLSQAPKFCPECGNPLSADNNSVADQSSLLRTYIPKELADRMMSAGKTLESERRVVTVLFADVSGFTAMSEKLDPEQVSTILNECFRGLVEIVYRYEGFVDKFIGDEIMAIFGAPIAHENDPERAIRCAVEMHSFINRFNSLAPISLPHPLGIHIGVNTGTVVAGNVGSDLRMNYSVIGDTVNLAARLVSYSKTGQILTSESTYNSVHHLLKTGNPEMATLKGKSEPVKVYPIIGIDESSLPGERVIRKTAFIGRAEEITIFQQCLEDLQRQKESRLFIRGEAGVGKSRLKLEFETIAQSSGVAMYEGKCSGFETTTPYYLWNTLLKSLLSISREAPEAETRSRLHDFLQILGLKDHEPYLATLLSLRYEQILMEEDEQRKGKIFGSVVELIKALSQRKKTLIVFEDLHWLDRFSDSLLHHVFRESALAPAVFIFLYRGEYQRSVDLIHAGEKLLDLNRLSSNEAVKLMVSRFGVGEIPSQISDIIYQRSEGNPFFVEEIIRTMLDRKSVEVDRGALKIREQNISDVIPDTVQGIIMSRIDRLEEKIKEVLFQASVIGREFSRPVLEKVASRAEGLSDSLKTLNSLELILPKEEARELEYLFKHYLIQEVAYNTILIKRRKELHAKIAHAIETLYADKLRDFYELLSFHYEKAEEWDKAADYLARSGRKVQEMFSKEESQSFEERKQTAIDKLFESAGARRLGLSIVGWLIMVFAVPIALLGIILPASFMMMLYQLPPEFYLLVFGPGWIGKVNLTIYITYVWILYPWVGMTFFFWGILPFFRPKPKIYDITDDAVRIGFTNGKMMNFPFAQLDNIFFIDPQLKRKRPLWQVFFDPFYRHPELAEETFSKSILKILRLNIPIYAFGFESRKGAVRLKRKKGFDSMRLLLPWLNTPSRTKYISLATSAPAEFTQQANLAFEKWRVKHGEAR